MKAVTSYPFSMNAGGTFQITTEGDYFRIQSALGSVSVTVEGSGTLPNLQAGQGIKNTPFKRLILHNTSGAANSGVILVASEEFIDNRTYGINDLSAGSLNALRQPLAPTGFFGDVSALTGNTAVQVFSPASNLNGAVLLSANMSSMLGAAVCTQTFIHKDSAPTSIVDGSVLLMSVAGGILSGSNYSAGANLPKEQFIPAGQGLYFVSEVATPVVAGNYRAARFILL